MWLRLRRSVALLWASCFLLVPTSALAAPDVFLDAGALQADLRAQMEAERPQLSYTSSTSDATHLVRLQQSPGALRLEVLALDTPTPTSISQRVIPLRDGMPTALRLATLLALRALALAEELQLSPPPPPPPPKRFGVSARLSGLWWQSPALPQMGLGLSFHFWWRDWGLSARADLAGVPCCIRDVAGLSGQSREVLLLMEGSWRFWRSGAWSSRALVGAGVNLVRLEYTPKVRTPEQPFGFFDRAPSDVVNQTQFAARLGLALEYAIWKDWLVASVALGGQLKLPSLRVDFPEAGGYNGNPLDTGFFLPWFEGGLRINFL